MHINQIFILAVCLVGTLARPRRPPFNPAFEHFPDLIPPHTPPAVALLMEGFYTLNDIAVEFHHLLKEFDYATTTPFKLLKMSKVAKKSHQVTEDLLHALIIGPNFNEAESRLIVNKPMMTVAATSSKITEQLRIKFLHFDRALNFKGSLCHLIAKSLQRESDTSTHLFMVLERRLHPSMKPVLKISSQGMEKDRQSLIELYKKGSDKFDVSEFSLGKTLVAWLFKHRRKQTWTQCLIFERQHGRTEDEALDFCGITRDAWGKFWRNHTAFKTNICIETGVVDARIPKAEDANTMYYKCSNASLASPWHCIGDCPRRIGFRPSEGNLAYMNGFKDAVDGTFLEDD